MDSKPSTIKKEIKVTKPTFTAKRKLEIMTMFRENGFNVEKTCKQAGINETMLKEIWRDSGLPSIDTPAVLTSPVATQSDIEKAKLKTSLDLRKAQGETIDRLRDLIVNSEDGDFVVKALDAITRALKEDREESAGISGAMKKSGTLNFINNQYVTRNKSMNGNNKNPGNK
jgi:hypothetical protein